MRFLCRVLMLAGLAHGAFADEMPTGLFRGTLLGWEGSAAMGVLSARAAAGGVFDCRYDAKSFLEFEKRRVTVDKLREGDPLEVLAHRRPGDTACYILSLAVVPPPAPARPTRRMDPTPAPPKPTRGVARLRSETFAGVVTRVEDGAVTLRLRDRVETFLLRHDTRFLGDGLRMEWSDVSVNQRLSVEAARNADGEWEAFQLIWTRAPATRF